MSEQGATEVIRRRWRRGTLREVSLEEGGAVLCKRFWRAPGTRGERAWQLDYAALKRLKGVVVAEPLSITEWPEAGGISGVFRRSYVEGEPLPEVSAADIPLLSSLLAAIHTRGVITHDVNVDNLLRRPDGRLDCIDFGKARCYHRLNVRFQFAVGRELARAEREALRGDRQRFRTLLSAYFRDVDASRTQRGLILAGVCVARFSRWIRGGGRSRNADRAHDADDAAVSTRRERLPSGTLFFSAPRSESVAIETFVRKNGVMTLSDNERIATHNRRYRLWITRIEGVATPCVVKMAWANPEYGFSRRIGLWFSQQFRNVVRAAFEGSAMLREAGIPTIDALAWWTQRDPLIQRQQFFLYRCIDADGSATDVLERMLAGDPERSVLVEHLAAMVNALFQAGLRHCDLALGNYLVKRTADGWKVWLIDTDSVSRARSRPGAVRRFFDLACLRRLNLRGEERDLFLRHVLGASDTPFWRSVVEFWVIGGNRRPLRCAWRIWRPRKGH